MSTTFHAWNPTSGEPIDRAYSLSDHKQLSCMAENAPTSIEPAAAAAFLEAYVDALEEDKDAITAMAHEETGLPLDTRLRYARLQGRPRSDQRGQ